MLENAGALVHGVIGDGASINRKMWASIGTWNSSFNHPLSNDRKVFMFSLTIQRAAGSNEHPTCPTFLQLYKLLSVYNIITTKSKTTDSLEKLKKQIDNIITKNEWEVDEIIEHDYSLASN